MMYDVPLVCLNVAASSQTSSHQTFRIVLLKSQNSSKLAHNNQLTMFHGSEYLLLDPDQAERY